MHTRSYRHLSAEERETLSLGLAQGQSLRTMARILGRAPSTVSREVTRNTTRGRPYRACTAQQHATSRAHHPRRCRKLLDPWLWQYVQTQLMQGCSPEQIAGRLRRAYPGDMQKHLSPETIYAGLYVLPRGALRSELLAALRQARKARRPRARGADRRGHIPNMRPIAERPAEVTTRTVPGHWEGDLLKGACNRSAVGTLVERTTRLVILARMDGTDARSAREAFTKTLRHVPAPLRKTLTYDRGKEMADHEQLAHRLSIQVFFADPHAPWQRGTNENTNGLLRQYLPKGTDLSHDTQRELNAIAHRLNTRPRKCLDFATPLEVYAPLRHHSPVALGT
ncbi:MAG: IS30 family transposase [Nitrospira sp.]|nr:IS30 family transposase [Nitrospira sp.]MDR4464639.1 IS30 family transposase [Nitrospira sp.]MDR4466255.1 IS30 family transposase [Nitrospira sp.]